MRPQSRELLICVQGKHELASGKYPSRCARPQPTGQQKLRAAGFCPRRPRSIEFAKLFAFGLTAKSAIRFYPCRRLATKSRSLLARHREQDMPGFTRTAPPEAAPPSVASGFSPREQFGFTRIAVSELPVKPASGFDLLRATGFSRLPAAAASKKHALGFSRKGNSRVLPPLRF